MKHLGQPRSKSKPNQGWIPKPSLSESTWF
jgi:hypothetical protein